MKRHLSWAGRTGQFIHQMFPVFPAQVAVVGSFAATYSVMAAIFVPGPIAGIELLCGSFSMLIFSLLLRTFEELKNPEPAKGIVTHDDLRILAALLIAALFFLHVPFLLRPVLRWMLICLGYSFLVFKRFFLEKKLGTPPLLALLTRHPFAFLLQGYILSYFGSPSTLPAEALIFAAGAGLGATATVWEISRKARGSSAALAAAVTASFFLTYLPLSDVSGSDAARAAWLLPAAGWIAVLVQVARFVHKPQKAPRLLKAVEAYGMLMLAGMLLAAMFG